MSDQGKADKVKGRVEEAAGSLLDDDELKRTGRADQKAGEAKDKTADIVDQAADAASKLAEKAKKKAGEIIDTVRDGAKGSGSSSR